MAEFILVHGSWLGAWRGREIVGRLEQRGHLAAALDLPDTEKTALLLRP